MYPDQFDKIGSMPGAVRLLVNKNIHPHIDAPRKTPIALKDYIKQELDNMVKDKIIRKITEPINWVSSLAYSHKKDGSLRICLDRRHLNTALRRPHHATPTIEEITHHFTGAKIFSKLDTKAGYWSIHLDTESQIWQVLLSAVTIRIERITRHLPNEDVSNTWVRWWRYWNRRWRRCLC